MTRSLVEETNGFFVAMLARRFGWSLGWLSPNNSLHHLFALVLAMIETLEGDESTPFIVSVLGSASLCRTILLSAYRGHRTVEGAVRQEVRPGNLSSPRVAGDYWVANCRVLYSGTRSSEGTVPWIAPYALGGLRDNGQGIQHAPSPATSRVREGCQVVCTARG